jgi:uncharacterized membrane protein YkvA (DUF1232 family)
MFDLFKSVVRNLSPSEISRITDQYAEKSRELEKAGGWEIVAAGKRLWGYFMDPRAPTSVKAIAGLALLYFIVPLDSIPDITPALGYMDDLAVMSAALANIGRATKTIHDTRKYPHLEVVK